MKVKLVQSAALLLKPPILSSRVFQGWGVISGRLGGGVTEHTWM